jgi:hypothetical protein
MEHLDALKHALRRSWSLDTCYPADKEKWTIDRPAIGQCAVTSLVINDLFGGKIAYNRQFKHYWNIFENGDMIDLTREQFGTSSFSVDSITTREYLLKSERALQANTPRRYALLKERVEKLLLVEFVK